MLGILSGWLFQGLHGDQRPMSSLIKEFYRVLFAICDEDSTLLKLQWT